MDEKEGEILKKAYDSTPGEAVYAHLRLIQMTGQYGRLKLLGLVTSRRGR